MTTPRVLDPWRLVWGQPYIDSDRLLTECHAFPDDTALRPQILESWRFILQEPLFPDGEAPPLHL
ncbi:MAG: hypothetical protein ACYC61_04110 [Isosphaeraceae bacterium]